MKMSFLTSLSCTSLRTQLVSDVDRRLTKINCTEDIGWSDCKIMLLKLKKASLEAQIAASRTQALIDEMELKLVQQELQELLTDVSSTRLSTSPARPQANTTRRPYRLVRPVRKVIRPRYPVIKRNKNITKPIHQAEPTIEADKQVSHTSTHVGNEGQSKDQKMESSMAEKRKADAERKETGDQKSKKVKISSGKDAQKRHGKEISSTTTEDVKHRAAAKSDNSAKHGTVSKKSSNKIKIMETEKVKTNKKSNEASNGQSDVSKNQTDKDNSTEAKYNQSEVHKKRSDKNKSKETNDTQGDVSKHNHRRSHDSKTKSSKEKDKSHERKKSTKSSNNTVNEVNYDDHQTGLLKSVLKKPNVTQNLESRAYDEEINKNNALHIVVTKAVVHASNGYQGVNNNDKEHTVSDSNATSDIPLTLNTQVITDNIEQRLEELFKSEPEDRKSNNVLIKQERSPSISSVETLVLGELCNGTQIEALEYRDD